MIILFTVKFCGLGVSGLVTDAGLGRVVGLGGMEGLIGGGLWPVRPSLRVGVASVAGVGVLTLQVRQGVTGRAGAGAACAQLPCVAVTLIISSY